MSLVLNGSWESGFLKCPQGHLSYSQAWDLTAACSPFQPSQASFKGNLTLIYHFHLFSFFWIISNSYTMPQTLLSENEWKILPGPTIHNNYLLCLCTFQVKQNSRTRCPHRLSLLSHQLFNLKSAPDWVLLQNWSPCCLKTFTSLGLKDPRFSCCFLPASPCQGLSPWSLSVESSSGHGIWPSFLFTLLLMLSGLWDLGADNTCSDHSISLLPAHPNPCLVFLSIRWVIDISELIVQTESWCPPTLRWFSYTASSCVSFLWLL